MRAQYRKSFLKQFAKLQPAQVSRLKAALRLFELEPNHPDLYNHKLTGEWTGFHSIAFGGDWRAHYRQEDDIAIFVACGTHAKLYK